MKRMGGKGLWPGAALVVVLLLVVGLGLARPCYAVEWDEVATGVLLAERVGVIDLSWLLGRAPRSERPGQYGYYRGPYYCDVRDGACRAARAYREGVDRALREQAAQVEREARERGYCEAGGSWCRLGAQASRGTRY